MSKIKRILIDILMKIGDWLNEDRTDEQIVRDLKKYNQEIAPNSSRS